MANNNPFTYTEAVRVAKYFVRRGGIVQVMAYGSIARNKQGRDLDLIFVVGGDQRFQDFVDLMRVYQQHNGAEKRSLRGMRMAAFETMWCKGDPLWRNCLPGREETLRAYLDPLVLPWSWRDRQDELRHLVGEHGSIAKLAKEAVVLVSDS
jgi:predicted nucleotidyltransferase